MAETDTTAEKGLEERYQDLLEAQNFLVDQYAALTKELESGRHMVEWADGIIDGQGNTIQRLRDQNDSLIQSIKLKYLQLQCEREQHKVALAKVLAELSKKDEVLQEWRCDNELKDALESLMTIAEAAMAGDHQTVAANYDDAMAAARDALHN